MGRNASKKESDMHTPGIVPMLIIAVVVLVLFGRGKISSLMGEVGKGITAFKRGVKDSTDEIANETTVKDVTPEKDKV
jgi:sec-independent protein translocase protein TatA